jgi:hypothetical protein
MRNYRRTLCLAFGILGLLAWTTVQRAAGMEPVAMRPTLAPAGPFHISGNQILDSKGRPFVIRGTQVAPFHPETAAHDNRAGADYGAHSATTLSAIRLRFNMNAVRVPVDLGESTKPGYFPALASVVRRANQMDLLVILAAGESGERHDRLPAYAAYFKEYPNVMFETSFGKGPDDPVHAIRAAGASQPVLVMSAHGAALDETNIIYEV